MKLSFQAAILVCVPLAFEIILCALLAVLFFQFDSQRARLASARALTSHLTRLVGGFCNQAAPALISTLTDNEGFRQRLYEHQKSADAQLKEIERLAKGYPPEYQAAAELVLDAQRFKQRLSEASSLTLDGDKAAAMKAWVEAVRYEESLFNSIEKILARLRRVEQSGLQSLSNHENLIAWFLFWAVFSNVILVLVLLWFFHNRTSLALAVLSSNVWRFAANQPLIAPVDGAQEIVLIDRRFREMTDKIKQARLRQRAVIDNSVDVICSVDSQGKFSEVSQSCHEQWGYSADELLQARLSQVVSPADLDDITRLIKEAQAYQAPKAVEVRVRHKDGRQLDTLWSTHWSASEQSLICVTHDMSDVKRLADLKRQFVFLVRDDLRKPLVKIQELHNLISAHAFGRVSQAGLNKLSTLQFEIPRLIGLVDGLLDIHRLEAGRLALSFEEVPLYAVLHASIQSVSNFAESRNITIERAGNSDVSIVADKGRLVQVIINLLTNAIKYSKTDSAVVVKTDLGDDSITVSVIDQGKGVPAHLCQSIFERFRQVEFADERVRAGKGLGLAISKAIVEAHNGTIGVNSTEGSGSTFWIRLARSNSFEQNSPASGQGATSP